MFKKSHLLSKDKIIFLRYYPVLLLNFIAVSPALFVDKFAPSFDGIIIDPGDQGPEREDDTDTNVTSITSLNHMNSRYWDRVSLVNHLIITAPIFS